MFSHSTTLLESLGAGGMMRSMSSSCSGASWSATSKYLSMRSRDLVRRADGLRRTHSSSFLRKRWRLCSFTASTAMRSARVIMYSV